MDVLGVQEMKISKHHHHHDGHKINKRCKKGIKVVYISSPMKVKTCASKFRALVQELTGKNSDADAAALRFSHVVNDSQNFPTEVVVDDDHQQHQDQDTSAVSSSTSGGVAAAMDHQFDGDDDDDLFMPHREGSFLGMFTSNLFSHDFNFQQDYALPSFQSM